MEATRSMLPQDFPGQEFADPVMDGLLELEAAARVLDLEDWIIERLRHPELDEARSLLLRKDNGQAVTVPVLHVEHNTGRGMACGKLSLAPDAFAAQLRNEAMSGTWQHALFGIAFGGGATAIICDPRNLSERELQRVAGGFASLEFSRPHVTRSGAGMNECIAGWMHGARNSFVCGAPEALGGVAQHESAALVISEIIRHGCSHRGAKLSGQRVAIQGFEESSRELATLLYHAGAQVVAVADVSGGLIDPMGLNIDAVRTHAEREGVLLGYPEAEAVNNAEVLECDCDVLVLADGVSQVTEANVGRIHARVVIECVHAALAPSAERALIERNAEVVPEILAGAGPALAAFIEHAQHSEAHWSRSRRGAFIRRTTRRALDDVIAASLKWNIGRRHAALALSVQRVSGAIRAKGF